MAASCWKQGAAALWFTSICDHILPAMSPLQLPSAIWSLFICLTTANFPDIMMPIYDHGRVFAFFFCIYLVLGLFFGLNMVTAVTYQTYTDEYDKYAPPAEWHLRPLRRSSLP